MSFQPIQGDCKRIIGTISHCSNDELDAIINDDQKFEELLNTLDQSYLNNLESEKDSINTAINELSEANLTREPELVEGREKIELLSTEGEELAKIVADKYQELRNKGGDMSTETALALLQTAASEMEEESDSIAKKFLDQEADLDPFLDEFLTKRKIMHLRLVKAEKLSKILSRDPVFNSAAGGNYINAPPMSINSHYFPEVPAVNPAAVPYPTGPLNMPMPGMSFFQNHY